MKSMDEVERRSKEISRRMKAIQIELRSSDLNPAQAFNLAEELVILYNESQMLDASVYQFRALAEQLLSSRCSGPH